MPKKQIKQEQIRSFPWLAGEGQFESPVSLKTLLHLGQITVAIQRVQQETAKDMRLAARYTAHPIRHDDGGSIHCEENEQFQAEIFDLLHLAKYTLE